LFELIEATVLRTALEFCEQNQVQTARLLAISRNVLRHRMALYGLLPNSQGEKVNAAGSAYAPARPSHSPAQGCCD
jgi:sigma-54-specific transcriptional regulator